MKRLIPSVIGVFLAITLTACGTSSGQTAAAKPSAASSTKAVAKAAPIAVQKTSTPNAAACAAFNTQSAAYQAPVSGSSDSPSAVAARDTKFLGQVSQDAYNSTGAVHSALTSFASAFVEYMGATATGEATSAEISALNSAGSAVNTACGH